MPHRKLYPIGYVARATGLSAHVIRAWERRYRAVAPARSAKNRRLYSLNDIDHLLLLKNARSQGQRIAAASLLDEPRLRQLETNYMPRSAGEAGAAALVNGQAPASALLDVCLESVRRLDPAGLRAALGSASVSLARPSLLGRLIGPLMAGIGSAWADGSLRIVHEHLATAVVREFLFGLLMSTPRQDSAPRMVAATPAGQSCEIGALAAAVTAAESGWRVGYIGASLPAEEIAAAAALTRAEAVALSVTCSNGGDALAGEIVRLRTLVGRGPRIFVGGRAAASVAAASEAAEGELVDGLADFGNLVLRSEAAGTT
ncbi:MAG: MerR family transcriptional regulator [Desulfobacterales bacterium]|jgi:methanogenic corrinoid protein MtbC1|nr:MerR family transcriptional regulator [Desulfobacterales bacterium]